ncbi:Regulator of chromosome condensation 1/beta-lactamase-inhibitor protein II [Pseudocohnilembus persalinus]|uniref:Regulator of chromosome condensation 1/beta-lactamase-inhibitor protein II n=1 Tax=Pseudocohnilembus persalinus TaxID=266149 RepID=A0A0V0QKS9_PSEPJ|nr:Regulator of chromosome condensation 1/beta-lactamase-inhibitor protein II [Pseudocohnilembus persalinus]|eukprot:KRX02820.1 Regulator of chromosome condensation 1/beta-lactamase-inhibitor protein II [Pseudocohnilembus persalinus]
MKAAALIIQRNVRKFVLLRLIKKERFQFYEYAENPEENDFEEEFELYGEQALLTIQQQQNKLILNSQSDNYENKYNSPNQKSQHQQQQILSSQSKTQLSNNMKSNLKQQTSLNKSNTPLKNNEYEPGSNSSWKNQLFDPVYASNLVDKKLYLFNQIIDLQLLTNTRFIYSNDENFEHSKQTWSSLYADIFSQGYGQSNFVQNVQIGSAHSMCVTSNSSVYTFGWNDMQQCGLDIDQSSELEKSSQKQFYEIKFPSKIQMASSCKDFNLVLDDKGQVYQWGNGSGIELVSGNLPLEYQKKFIPGVGTVSPDQGYDISSPPLFQNLKIKSIQASNQQNYAVDFEGNLYGWPLLEHQKEDQQQFMEENFLDEEQLSPFYLFDLQQYFPQVKQKIQVGQISCGLNFTLILTTTGHLFSFGNNSEGQLGHGDKENRQWPELIENFKHIKIQSIDCGMKHCIANSTNNKVYTWGWGAKGQLGHGDLENQTSPKQLQLVFKDTLSNQNSKIFNSTNSVYGQQGSQQDSNLFKVLQVKASRTGSLYLLNNGQIFWFGSNSYLKNQSLPVRFYEQLRCPQIAKNSFYPVRIQSSYSNSVSQISVTYVYTDKDKQMQNSAFRSKMLNILTQKWVQNQVQSINPPFDQNLSNYISINNMVKGEYYQNQQIQQQKIKQYSQKNQSQTKNSTILQSSGSKFDFASTYSHFNNQSANIKIKPHFRPKTEDQIEFEQQFYIDKKKEREEEKERHKQKEELIKKQNKQKKLQSQKKIENINQQKQLNSFKQQSLQQSIQSTQRNNQQRINNFQAQQDQQNLIKDQLQILKQNQTQKEHQIQQDYNENSQNSISEISEFNLKQEISNPNNQNLKSIHNNRHDNIHNNYIDLNQNNQQMHFYNQNNFNINQNQQQQLQKKLSESSHSPSKIQLEIKNFDKAVKEQFLKHNENSLNISEINKQQQFMTQNQENYQQDSEFNSNFSSSRFRDLTKSQLQNKGSINNNSNNQNNIEIDQALNNIQIEGNNILNQFQVQNKQNNENLIQQQKNTSPNFALNQNYKSQKIDQSSGFLSEQQQENPVGLSDSQLEIQLQADDFKKLRNVQNLTKKIQALQQQPYDSLNEKDKKLLELSNDKYFRALQQQIVQYQQYLN